MRKALNGMKSDEAVEQILNMFARTANNAEFVQMVKTEIVMFTKNTVQNIIWD